MPLVTVTTDKKQCQLGMPLFKHLYDV